MHEIQGSFPSQIFALRTIGVLKFRQAIESANLSTRVMSTHCIHKKVVGIASGNVFACNCPMFSTLVVPGNSQGTEY